MMIPRLYMILLSLLLLVVGLFSSCRKYEEGIMISDRSGFTGKDFFAVAFSKIGEAYAMGGTKYEVGVRMKSENNGYNWSEVDPFSEKMIYDLDFVGPHRAYAGAGNGKLMRSDDGGASWFPIQVHTEEYGWQPLKGVDFVDANVGFLVAGTNTSQGFIYKTVNGGWEWVYEVFNYELRDIEMVSELVGFACGYGIIYRTHDGGASWHPLSQTGDFYMAMDFVSESVGYIVGDEGSIIKTVDGGDSWEVLRKTNKVLKRNYHFADVVFADEQLGYVVGEGVMMVTENGGADWKEVKDIPDCRFKSIALRDDRSGIAVGKDGCVVVFEW